MVLARRGRRLPRLALALFFVSFAGWRLVAEDIPPRVLGYQRIYGQSSTDPVGAGRLLLGELNCTSCHQADERWSADIQKKPAPILDSVCQRVQPQYLLKFLADPQATKPGTTMPNVLLAVPEAERASVVEALVHFLAITGQIVHANPSLQAINRGEILFHGVGCVACHDPRTEPPAKAFAASIPLGTPSRKYTLPGLTQFLLDPLAVRPGGRMPHLNLSALEGRDIASFLMNDLDVVSGLQYAYYEGDWEKLPKFDTLNPVATGDAEAFDLQPARRKDRFALRFEGTIQLPIDGDYLFLIGSDDGSRLLIDDKLIVVADGVHPFEQKRKRVKMAAGLHSVIVEYFEQAGDEALQVDFEGPGMTQQPLAALLTTPSSQKTGVAQSDSFLVDPKKAAKGREYFASLGCAACHTLKDSGSPIAATKLATPLSELKGRGACLDAATSMAPRYALSDQQRTALTAALASLQNTFGKPNPAEVVERTLVRFNCIACHERNTLGGVPSERDEFFISDMPEMGDEGRLPPSLTGVGAKLTTAWLRSLLEHGAKDRPYMFTRMPKFGLPNVSHVVEALEQADASLVKAAPEFVVADDDEKRVKAAGRRLVGSQGFSCIKCHTFAGQRSSGIQALSLTTMTSRLRRDWFYYYLQSPLAYRPGTRMPTPFPDGQTTLPAVFDGTVGGQIGAIWNYLSDGDKATFPVGLVTGKMELIAFDEAVIYRNFIEGAGTRAIGVGYPEKLNLAFDAEACRLAMLWHGGFIDAARHWSARGAGFEKPLGDKVLHLPPGPPIAHLANDKESWPTLPARELGFQFAGYRLGVKQQPTFLYSWMGKMQIEDTPRPAGRDDLFSMQRGIVISAERPATNCWLRAASAGKIEASGSDVFKIDGRWTLKVVSKSKPLVRQQEKSQELLVPIVLDGNRAEIELTYDW